MRPAAKLVPSSDDCILLLTGRRDMMKFVVVSDRRPKNSSLCAVCCEKIEGGYVRERGTRLLYCDHICYEDRVKVAVVAHEYKARAS
jgi:hypothetical protein